MQQIAAMCTWPAEGNPMKNMQTDCMQGGSVLWHVRLLHPDAGVAADEDTAGEKRWHAFDDLLRACEPHDHKAQLLITSIGFDHINIISQSSQSQTLVKRNATSAQC
jgi:hypothetical protein